ncbi:MAG: DUF3301 domain-containing protein [Thalassotalea sp.]
MGNIYILLFVLVIFWYFIYLRKVAEMGKYHAQQYCKQENLQFIDVARRSSKLRFNKQFGIHWLSDFDFEFSGDGESKYKAEIIMRGLKLENIDVPPYRVH